MTGQIDVVEVNDQKQCKGIVLSTIPVIRIMTEGIKCKCGVLNHSVLFLFRLLLFVAGFEISSLF